MPLGSTVIQIYIVNTANPVCQISTLEIHLPRGKDDLTMVTVLIVDVFTFDVDTNSR